MLASKFAFVSIRSSVLNTGNVIQKSLIKPNFNIVRLYREAGRKFGQKRARTDDLGVNTSTTQNVLKQKLGPLQVGEAVLAGGAVLGLGGLCYYGLGLSNESGAIDRMYIWPEYVRARIRDTYLYFGASVSVTAASAVAIFRSPVGMRYFNFCARHPIMSTVGVIAALIGTGQAMMSIPYSTGIGAKQAMWLINCGMIGLAVAPVAALGGAIAVKAAWYTAGVIGGLSTIAVCAPSEKFINWAGPLGICFGGVLIATLGSAFMAPTSTLGLSLYSVSLYGGLLLFSAFLLYDTQKIMRSAEMHPPPGRYEMRPYDPINASHHIVMDSVNIFVRIAQILFMGRRK